MQRPPQQPAVPTGIGVVEVTEPLDSFDFSAARRWDLLVLHRGEPVARLGLPSPGPIDSAALARALIWPHAETRRRAEEIAQLVLRRLGAPEREASRPPSCSVVVCTHGRPRHLATALEALGRLDPAPLEVVVVDNAPGERDCEADVLRRGFRYVREDRKGLDNARNAGVRAARGEVIAFTDDDCVQPPGWLRQLGEAFEDPLVAALTGPAFPYALDTPARLRMERQASLTRGLQRRIFDWTLISPLHAGQAGVGANMTIRASLLRSVPEPFPPELDAGTETESGGDTYVFARLLAAGHRIVYDPRAYVFHQHRDDWPALDRAVRGYGTGASAALTKLLLEDGELEAPRAGLWLLSQYLRTQRRRALGRADAVETRIAWSYVRGALRGPTAWRRALGTQRSIDPGLRPAPPFPPPTAAGPTDWRRAPAGEPEIDAAESATPSTDRTSVVVADDVGEASLPAPTDAPAVSVIVPTVGRAAVLGRCLAALAAQTLPPGAFEVIVVDDSPHADVVLPAHEGLSARVHRSGGKGAAVARNEGAAVARGELLLFLDDDLIAAPDLLERHLAAQATPDAGAVVIGYSPPRPPRPGLAALGAALWWEDQFRLLERTAALTFTEALSGNVSLRRDLFLADRRFDPGFARLRREDWEWGLRLLGDGVELRYEPAAVAAHEYELSAGARIRACRLEGGGDALLVAQHPGAAAFLPLAQHRPPSWRRPLRWLVAAALGHPRADALTLPVLDALELARLRSAWSALYRRAQRAAYAHGLRAGGWRPGPLPPPPLLDVELSSEQPLPPPGAILPQLRVTHAGRELLRVLPKSGWHPRLATELGAELSSVADLNGRPGEPAHALRTSVTVLLDPAGQPDADRQLGELTAAGAMVQQLARIPADRQGRDWQTGEPSAVGATVERLAGTPAGRGSRDRLPGELSGGRPAEYWQSVLEAVAAATTELIAIPLRGRAPTARWLTEVEPAFEGPLVLLALGQGLPETSPVEPITLHDRGRGRMPYAPLGGVADYLVLRAAALPQLRRATRHAALGPLAVAFACSEEVLAAGGLVAHRNAHGLGPAGGRWATAAERERAKLTAWGGLLATHALEQHRLRGTAWLGGVTAGAVALSLRRALRDDRHPVSPIDTTSSLLRGYAAAIRQTGRR